MTHVPRPGNSYGNTQLTLFFCGLSATLVYPLLNLDSFVFLRFLGITIYEAESMAFLLRRFNLLVGALSCMFVLLVGKSADCSYWTWLLLASYFSTCFYVYLLSHSYMLVGKLALLLVLFISFTSHGLLISVFKLIFSKDQIFLHSDPLDRLVIFLCGCFSSGIVVRILVSFSGGHVFSDTDTYNTLKLFNRLMISITTITLATSFLLSTFECLDVEEDYESKAPPSLFKFMISGKFWLFTLSYFGWSLSPMLNNLSLTVMHVINRKESYQLEFIQFLTSLVVTLIMYATVFGDTSMHRPGYTYNSLYRSLCHILRYRGFTPIVPNSSSHQDVRENIEVLSKAISIRLFSQVQAWCSLPYGFWSDWEEYDNFSNSRLMSVLTIHMTLTGIREQDPSQFAEYYHIGCDEPLTPADYFLVVISCKYTLLWLICSYINFSNVLQCKIKSYFPKGSSSCCVADLQTICHKCCEKESTVRCTCSGSCCYNENTAQSLQNYIKEALKASSEECNALLYDIHTSPQLADSYKERVSTIDELLASLSVFEEILMRFVGFMLYGKLMDEYLTIQKFMKGICSKLANDAKKFRERCSCNRSPSTSSNGNSADAKNTTPKCACLLYCMMVQCVCNLHARQRKASEIMEGTSLENLIDVMPPMALSRSILIIGSIFGPLMESELLYEEATCKCKEKDKEKESCLCCLKCCCCRFNSRIYDILNLALRAIDTPIDCDALLSSVITVASTFTSFKYPVNYHHSIYTIEELSGEDEDSSSSTYTNVLSVFAKIYADFSSLMASLLPSGHIKPGSSCSMCQSEAGLCHCLRQLLSIIKEICCLVEMISAELGSTTVSVCYITNYHKVDYLYERLSCCAKKLSTVCTCVTNGKCTEKGCCCGQSLGTDCQQLCEFVKQLCTSLSSTVTLVKSLNDESKKSIQAINDSLKDQLKSLNDKNVNLYKSLRGTRMGMLITPSRLFSKLIKTYKNPIIGIVSGLKKWEFFGFIFLILTFLFLIYLGRLLPYLKNIPNSVKFKCLIILYAIFETYFLNYSFAYLSSFGPDSSYFISLAIIFGIFLSIIYSWLTQWFNYRMYLFEQFVELYSRFRLLFPGSKYSEYPTPFWWFEGFVSFLKMDMISMYYLFTFTRSKQTYNQFSFGFSAKLEVDYDLVESDPHIFSYDECLSNIRKSVFESDFVRLQELLEFRSFHHIFTTDVSFMFEKSHKSFTYPLDLLYYAWTVNSRVSELSDRLHHLREIALKSIEKSVQMEAQNNNYDAASIQKLKSFFDFRHECLLDAPKHAVNDSRDKQESLLTLQARKLVKLYEKIYNDMWRAYLEKHHDDTIKKSGKAVFEDQPMNVFLKSYHDWITDKLKVCDTVFKGSDICNVSVRLTGTEFEKFAYLPTVSSTDVMAQFMSFCSKSFIETDIPGSLEIYKLLSQPREAPETKDIKDIINKVSDLVRGHSFGARSTIINHLINVCKNIAIESEITESVTKHDKFLVGEWVRWQGLYVSSDLVSLLIDFIIH